MTFKKIEKCNQSKRDFEVNNTKHSHEHVIGKRLMTAGETAAYLGYKSLTVLKRLPVKPITYFGSPRWDIFKVDAWLDSVGGYVSGTAQNIGAMSLDRELEIWSAANGV